MEENHYQKLVSSRSSISEKQTEAIDVIKNITDDFASKIANRKCKIYKLVPQIGNKARCYYTHFYFA